MRRPSPATVIATVALVMSTTGAAVAAVNYARNAGAVDGYSAVKAESSNRKAAGKLVAMDESGRLPLKFLTGAASVAANVTTLPVPDNGLSPPDRVVDLELGTLSAACFDQQEATGVENPATRFYLTNHAGAPLHATYRAGDGQGAVEVIPAGGAVSFVVGGQAMVQVQLQLGDIAVFGQGGARQIGQGTADGSCTAFAAAVLPNASPGPPVSDG